MKISKTSSKTQKIAMPLLLSIAVVGLQACDSSGSSNSETSTTVSATALDITDVIFTEMSGDCGDYVNTFTATPMDIQNSTSFTAAVEITATDTECTFVSNSVPNHNFNDETAAFAGGVAGATISEIDVEFTVTRSPVISPDGPTDISQELKNAIFLNGVKLDIISAGCYSPESADAGADGNTGIGCQSDSDWLLDPLNTDSKFGADFHNAHTQPGGSYHYHGGPLAMYDVNSVVESPVIGFAADGFPVYGPYFYDSDTGTVRKAESGYSVIVGSRGTQDDIGPDYNPGGTYTGEYNQDWEWSDTTGDLDECNGMTVDGQYGYYITDDYPHVLKCLSGTPDPSFGGGTETEGEGGGPPPGGDGGPPEAGADAPTV